MSICLYIYKRYKEREKMLTLTAPNPSHNNRNGNGKYSTLKRKKKAKKQEAETEEFSYLNSSVDLTMQFTATRDPIYMVFEKIEDRPVSALMKDFVQDSFFEISKFVSKVMK